MANLALGKIPLEKDKWNNPEQATNGNIVGYTGSSGFTSSPWPSSYTIDLGSEIKISTIRFLLWDNLGSVFKDPDKRKYNFSLEISSDNISYITIFSNEDKDGSNGWFVFRFVHETSARFLKLRGLRNTANDEFHIVEFEVHDQEPEKLNSPNVHAIDIVAKVADETRIGELINLRISEKSQLLSGIEEKIKSVDHLLIISKESLDQIELIKQSIDFERESGNNNNRARKWIIAAIVAFGIFLSLLLYLLFSDTHSQDIIKDAATNEVVKPYTTILLSAFYIAKAVFLSTILFVFGWFLRNYRSEKHNYVINKQKAMTLTVATGILTKDQYKNTERNEIFNEAMKIIFTHQASGFSKEENVNPSIVNALFQKGIPKTDS